MIIALIITLGEWLLRIYFFDMTSYQTKISSVILLLILGWAVGHITAYIEIEVPDLVSTLPFLGTIGLSLSILERSLEIELNKVKVSFVGKTSIIGFMPL